MKERKGNGQFVKIQNIFSDITTICDWIPYGIIRSEYNRGRKTRENSG